MCPVLVLEGLLNKILQIINTLRKVMILKQFYKKKKTRSTDQNVNIAMEHKVL